MTEAQWKVAWNLYRQISDLPASEQRAYLYSSEVAPEILAEVDSLLHTSDGLQTDATESGCPIAGSRLGGYLVVAKLGSGAMGNVCAAQDTELDRIVALKFLNPDQIGKPSAIDRYS